MKTIRALQAHEVELISGGRKPDPELTDHPQPDLPLEAQHMDRPDQICPITDPDVAVPF
jgi:hypothetical protein